MKALALALALAAATFASAIDYKAAGLSGLGPVSLDGKTYERLLDPSGGEIFLAIEAEPSPEALSNLAKASAALRSWKGLSIGEMRAVAEPGRIRLLVIPSSIKKDGTELSSYVLSGLQFFVSKSIEYDFRLKSGKYFIRLNAILGAEADLLGDIQRAAADPVSFLTERDPRYAIRRIAEVEEKLGSLEAGLLQTAEALKATDAEASASLARLFEELSAARAALAESEARTEERESRIQAELEAARSALQAELLALKKAEEDRALAAEAARAALEQAMAERIASLDKSGAEKSEAISKALDEERKLRKDFLEPALLTALNKGKPLPAPALAKLIELKTADPALSADAAVAALKAAKLALSKAQVLFVYQVIFHVNQ